MSSIPRIVFNGIKHNIVIRNVIVPAKIANDTNFKEYLHKTIITTYEGITSTYGYITKIHNIGDISYGRILSNGNREYDVSIECEMLDIANNNIIMSAKCMKAGNEVAIFIKDNIVIINVDKKRYNGVIIEPNKFYNIRILEFAPNIGKLPIDITYGSEFKKIDGTIIIEKKRLEAMSSKSEGDNYIFTVRNGDIVTVRKNLIEKVLYNYCYTIQGEIFIYYNIPKLLRFQNIVIDAKLEFNLKYDKEIEIINAIEDKYEEKWESYKNLITYPSKEIKKINIYEEIIKGNDIVYEVQGKPDIVLLIALFYKNTSIRRGNWSYEKGSTHIIEAKEPNMETIKNRTENLKKFSAKPPTEFFKKENQIMLRLESYYKTQKNIDNFLQAYSMELILRTTISQIAVLRPLIEEEIKKDIN